MEQRMETINPSGLALLHANIGVDLTGLKTSCQRALAMNRGSTLAFDPHAGDNMMLAAMKDVVESMGSATGRTV
eukprot:1060901-Prymnesium_polylepis.1